MAQNFLYEVTPFKAHIVEGAAGVPGRMVVEGVFQAADRKNANGRIYPKSLWEKILKSEATNKAIEERRMFGELDHPQDGKWELKRACHIVTAMSMNENGEIMGRAEILDTPNGRILQELFAAGATVGISSRGSGSVKRSNDGEVVQEDFKLETYDFVANPSTFGAFPKRVSEDVESNEVIKENSMDSREKLQLFENKAASVLSLKPSEVTGDMRSLAEGVSTELIINLSKLGSEAPEVKNLTESLIEELTAKRKELRTKFVEGMPPWLKDKDKDDDKDKKKDKKEEPKEKKKEEAIVAEGTTGSADQGIHRDIPVESKPASGEGWPININDAGVLNGINNGVDEFMSKAQPVPEAKDDDDDDADDEKKEMESVEEDEKDETDEATSRSEMLVEIALKLISVEQTEQNSFARAFAAAFLMENNKRVTESQAYQRIVGKLQEKLQEAAATGKITLSEVDSTELEEKLEAAYSAIEQLETRHRLLSAKVYAENELRKIGQHENADSRKVVAEAIRKAATKTSIDEAILGLAAIKGLKVTKLVDRVVNEEKVPEKTLEGPISKLAEDTKPNTALAGAALGKKLSEMINFSRSTPR
jgi:hypothetical protein